MTSDLLSPVDALNAPALGANVARRLTMIAARMPDAIAVAAPRGRDRHGRRKYDTVTFAQLEADSNRIAGGLQAQGVAPRTRLVLLVPPGVEFVTLVFGLLKAGIVIVLIDPGMGGRNLIACLREAKPQGFVAVPRVHAVRWLLRRQFPAARFNVTVGRQLFWDGITLDQLRHSGSGGRGLPALAPEDPAAIIFTTGSTGPPKGVLYRHENFDHQVTELRDFFGIQPGGVDLPGFPLFGLFNGAMGVTTVLPDMDFSRPAKVDPRMIVEAIHDWRVSQSFGSPAIWDRVGRYCEQHRIELPSMRRVTSAGAPVPPHVLARIKACISREGEVYTPYGATEALPIASIAASEVLRETSIASATGAGTCVGRRFPSIQWKIIRIADGPIPTLADVIEVSTGEIGELVVTGPVVTREYVTRREANATAKIIDGDKIWHRMGDVGYLDDQERFWFCGRVAHRVLTAEGPMYTVRCEAIFNRHPDVSRSALVGVGPADRQRPVIVAELRVARAGRGRRARRRLFSQLRELALANPLTARIEDFLVCRSMPVDVRHNAKIRREDLALWAARKLGSQVSRST